jgi:hypothetical protein
MSSLRTWLRRTIGVLVGLGMAVALPVLATPAFAVSGGFNTTALTAAKCLNGSQPIEYHLGHLLLCCARSGRAAKPQR